MGSTKRKLILSSIMLAMTFTCLTSTTYAWFARNKEAWTEEFNFDIDNYDGLLISIDGKNFTASINNQNLKKACIAKMHNINILEDSESAQPQLTNEFVDTEFAKIKIDGVTTNDGNYFETIDRFNGTNGYYNIIEANKYSYLSFDLYFTVEASRIADKTYDIAFVSTNYSESSDSNIPISKITSPDNYMNVYSQFTVNNTIYNSGDKIKSKTCDAMRIGVNHGDIFTIYEPNIGLGSYCLDGAIDDIHNPSNNYMLQHLNAYGEYDLKPLVDSNNIYANTEKNFDGEISLGKITPINNTDYSVAKITISIWLEGYDSDYLSPADLTELSCFLSFFKKEAL